jgi:arsenate reductase
MSKPRLIAFVCLHGAAKSLVAAEFCKRPRRLNQQDLAKATHIVSFGLDLAGIAPAGVPIERWDDCPAVTEDYATARNFIVARVEALLNRLPER